MEELPIGWRVVQETRYAGPTVDFVYVPYKWTTFTKRVGFWRRKVNMVGWRPAGPEFRDPTLAEKYVIDTDAAIALTRGQDSR